MADDRTATEGYQAPAVADRTDVAEPLNTATTSSNPLTTTPAWRRPEAD
jgi:hypothetical protein